MSEPASLQRVRKGELCSGCGGCAALAPGRIEMRVDPPGFLRPHQTGPVSDEEDRAIAAVCPGLGVSVHANGRTDEILWGPYLEVETGWASNHEVRHTGSSGGALSAILLRLVETGQVDGVVTTRAARTNPIGNEPVLATTREEILDAAGSRYAPSAPLADLQSYLDGGLRLAFVGKPCDVAALRAMARHDPRIDTSFPVMLSFFCAGVPSQSGGDAVLSALGTARDATAHFRFRGNGWPGRATAVGHDGQTRSMSYHDSWGRILSRHVQHRCKICADGTGMDADIVCADAWESDAEGYPLFEERDGVSLIMARTPKGKGIVDDARSAGIVVTEPFDISRLSAIQPGQRDRRRALAARLLALRLAGRPVPRYSGLHVWSAALQNSPVRLLRNFLGTLRRVIVGRV